MPFADSVFINCPFDDEYSAILRPMVFTAIRLGFTPGIATERLNFGQARIQKILAMIRESKFAIHDLSRIRAANAGDLFRLNMPFELGLDVRCREYRAGNARNKECLILEAERYQYQAALPTLQALIFKSMTTSQRKLYAT